MSTGSALDARPWPVALCFAAYGAVVVLRASEASLRPSLEQLAPPGAGRIAAERPDVTYSIVVADGWHEIYDGQQPIGRGRALEEMLVSLESQLHLRVATLARTRGGFSTSATSDPHWHRDSSGKSKVCWQLGSRDCFATCH